MWIENLAHLVRAAHSDGQAFMLHPHLKFEQTEKICQILGVKMSLRFSFFFFFVHSIHVCMHNYIESLSHWVHSIFSYGCTVTLVYVQNF